MRRAIYQATAADLERITSVRETQPFNGQRSPDEFSIKPDPELVREPDYQPSYVGVPVERSDIDVEISEQDTELIERLRETGEYGDKDGEIIRTSFLRWWLARLAQSENATAEMRGD